MDFVSGLQQALAYIEDHLDDDIDYAYAAQLAHSSEYHLQRAFSLLTGMTLGEYIRMRRLTLAAGDLQRGMKVIDTAVKYGYDSPDSFARAFSRFHGLPPSEARLPSARLNACAPLHIKLILEGGNMIDYRIEHKEPRKLLGIHRAFTGAPHGEKREAQEEALFVSTRAHQWMLRGLSDEQYMTDIVAVTDVTDEGYTFWYCCEPHAYALENLFDASVTGIDFMDRFGFEQLDVPAGRYAIFCTPKGKHPIADYRTLREQIAAQWLSGAGYTLRNAPELAIYHWYVGEEEHKRFIEVWIPVE